MDAAFAVLLIILSPSREKVTCFSMSKERDLAHATLAFVLTVDFREWHRTGLALYGTSAVKDRSAPFGAAVVRSNQLKAAVIPAKKS